MYQNCAPGGKWQNKSGQTVYEGSKRPQGWNRDRWGQRFTWKDGKRGVKGKKGKRAFYRFVPFAEKNPLLPFGLRRLTNRNFVRDLDVAPTAEVSRLLGRSAWKVYAFLLGFRNPDAVCYAKRTTIAEKCGLTLHQVKRALMRLLDVHLITYERVQCRTKTLSLWRVAGNTAFYASHELVIPTVAKSAIYMLRQHGGYRDGAGRPAVASLEAVKAPFECFSALTNQVAPPLNAISNVVGSTPTECYNSFGNSKKPSRAIRRERKRNLTTYETAKTFSSVSEVPDYIWACLSKQQVLEVVLHYLTGYTPWKPQALRFRSGAPTLATIQVSAHSTSYDYARDYVNSNFKLSPLPAPEVSEVRTKKVPKLDVATRLFVHELAFRTERKPLMDLKFTTFADLFSAGVPSKEVMDTLASKEGSEHMELSAQVRRARAKGRAKGLGAEVVHDLAYTVLAEYRWRAHGYAAALPPTIHGGLGMYPGYVYMCRLPRENLARMFYDAIIAYSVKAFRLRPFLPAFTPELERKLLKHLDALVAVGINDFYSWIDYSFCAWAALVPGSKSRVPGHKWMFALSRPASSVEAYRAWFRPQSNTFIVPLARWYAEHRKTAESRLHKLLDAFPTSAPSQVHLDAVVREAFEGYSPTVVRAAVLKRTQREQARLEAARDRGEWIWQQSISIVSTESSRPTRSTTRRRTPSSTTP